MPQPGRLPSDFSRSAAYPLFAMDPSSDRAWVLHFKPEDYRYASFLDRRALHSHGIPGWELSFSELNVAAGLTAPDLSVHWLFHISHCGSTLVSRLLDLLPGVLGLREPLPLLALAQITDPNIRGRWLKPVTRLLARGFDDTRAVIVKPTSSVSTLVEPLMSASPNGTRACLLWVDLQTWLATLLRQQSLVASTLETEALKLDGLDFPSANPATTDAQRLARLWLAEQWRWHRVRWRSHNMDALIDLDFAQVLEDPTAQLARLAAHFGMTVPDDWPERVAASGLLPRYAKEDLQAFDPEQRQRELADAAREHAYAIDATLAWADEAASRSELDWLRTRLRPTG